MTRTLSAAMLVLASAAAACAPSRSEILSPVRAEAAARTGFAVERRAAPAHDEDVRAAVAELLEEKLTLDAAIRIALLGHERVQAALDELGVARGDLMTATRIENPIVEAKLRFPVGDRARELDIDASQDVVSLIALGRRRGVASAELEAAKRDAVGSIVDLVAEVRQAYYRAVAAERELVMRQALLDAADASQTFAEALHDAGNITDLDLLLERDALELARLEVERAEQRRLAKRQQLSASLGLWGEHTAYVLPSALEDLPPEDPDTAPLERVAVDRSLELEAVEHRLLAAGGEIGLARLERWLPRLGVGVSAEREGGDWRVGPLVAISLPLWDWNTGAVRRSEARLSAEQRRYTALAVEIRAGARAAQARLRTARASAQRYRDRLLPLRERILEETRLAHHAMTASTFALLRARSRQIEAEVAYLEAKLEYWLARTAVDQIIAGRSPAHGAASAAKSDP